MPILPKPLFLAEGGTMSYQLLKLSDVCKAYGPKEILQHVSLTISHGDRLAIIGENGVGKSTLARLITRIEFPDSGVIETAEALRIGYLPQEVEGSSKECTVGEFLVGLCHSLRIRMEEIETRLANKEASEEVQQKLLIEWERCHEKLQTAGGYDIGHRCEMVLGGLGLSGMDCSMPLAKISGGERSKVAFARLLLESPDLLLLDEPTNHLDFRAIEWLEDFFLGYRGAVLMITHDRTFLNRVCNRLAELSSTTHQLTLYTGNYDAFLEERKRERERKLCEFVQWNEEKKALHQLIRSKSFAEAKPPPPKDGNTMAYDRRGEHYLRGKSRILRQAKGRLEELEAEKLTHPIPKAYRGIYFEPLELFSTVAIEAVGVLKSYEGRTLFTEVSFELKKGDRVVLQGDNGSGKTTLINAILGAVPLDGGGGEDISLRENRLSRPKS
jgi:ATPase subunit of ABC transporter with duplicated ATPase domains